MDGRVLLLPLRHQRRHLGVRGIERGVVCQTGDRLQRVALPGPEIGRVDCQRTPECRRGLRKGEAGSRHAHDNAIDSRDANRPADDALVTAVPPHPVAVVQDDDGRGAGKRVCLVEVTTEQHRRAQQSKEVGGDCRGGHALGIAVFDANCCGKGLIRRYLLHRLRLALVVEVFRHREGKLGEVESALRQESAVDGGQTIRIRIWKRVQQHAADYRERGGGAADAHGQSGDDEQRVRRPAPELTQRESEITVESTHVSSVCRPDAGWIVERACEERAPPPFGGGADEIDRGTRPERRHSEPASGASRRQAIREGERHVVRVAFAKLLGQGTNEQPAHQRRPAVLHGVFRPGTSFRWRACSRTDRRRADSACATRRPKGVSRK